MIEAILAQRIELYTTETLLAELEIVAARPKFTAKMAEQQLTPALLAERLRSIAEIVIAADIGPVVIADPDDDHVLACALAARADLIATGDPHLLNLKRHHGTLIVTPAEALLRVEQSSDR